MAKKRKTKQQKVIAQLKRHLASQATATPLKESPSEFSQEAISIEPKLSLKPKPTLKKVDNSVLLTDSRLIKKDLLKSLGLALLIISFQVVLYLKLR